MNGHKKNNNRLPMLNFQQKKQKNKERNKSKNKLIKIMSKVNKNKLEEIGKMLTQTI